MKYLFCSSKLSKRFVNAITNELNHPDTKLHTTIPGYVSMDDICRWHREWDLRRFPGIGLKTTIQALAGIKEEIDEMVKQESGKLANLYVKKAQIESKKS